MNSLESRQITIRPIISYPREAEADRAYSLTIDIQPGAGDWPYQNEEFALHCEVESEPLFTATPIGEQTIIVNRFGGTYGPVSFVLKANSSEMQGALRINFVNGYGLLVHQVVLPDIHVRSRRNRIFGSGLFTNGYALVIGLTHYANLPYTHLPYARQDTMGIVRTLQEPRYGGYPAKQVQLIQDRHATLERVRNAMSGLAARSDKNATILLYFAGHSQRGNGEHYLLLHDSSPRDLPSTALSGRELVARLARIPARQILLIFDCVQDDDPRGEFYTQLIESTPARNWFIITSAGPGELVVSRRGVENSLFAYHLQQALQGALHTAGDGLIRIFDLYDYVSNGVTDEYPKQHPMLIAKHGVENFPVALYRGGRQEMSSLEKGLGSVRVQNTLGEALEPAEQALLERMFADYDRVVVKERFGGDWSDGRVYLVRPVQGEWAELPTMLKMGPEPVIRQELTGYERFARHRVPRVARIDSQPVFVPARPLNWGGLRYQLAGDGQFYTESLAVYCQHATADDITYALQDQLFKSLDTLWRKSQPHDKPIGLSLDSVLPPNLMLEYLPQATAAIDLDPRPGQTYPVGTELALSGLVVTEVDLMKGELTLDLPAGELDNPGGYRVSVQGAPDLSQYVEGEPLPGVLTGRVLKTRDGVLWSRVTELFGMRIALEGQQVIIPGVGMLSNPLAHLPAVLRRTDDALYGPIHGDLNLENVLVEFDHRSNIIHLINFTHTREDWVLHDLLRLETNLWTYFVTAELERHGRTLADIPAFFAALRGDPAGEIPPGLQKAATVLNTVRQKVKEFLTTTPQAWDVYWRGLLAYMLGALEFGNLEPLSKQVAFVVAALCAEGGRVQPVMWQPALGQTPAAEVTSFELPTPPVPNLNNLLKELRSLLLHAEQFNTARALHTFFSIQEALNNWAGQLPEADSLQTRVDETVALLRDKRDYNGRHALVLLAETLAGEYDEQDGLHGQLKGIAGRLAAALQADL